DLALQLLLGAQLQTEVRHLALAALAVLAGAVFALVHRGLRTTPDVLAHTAVNFVLGRFALAHRIPFQMFVPESRGSRVKETRPPLAPLRRPDRTTHARIAKMSTGHVTTTSHLPVRSWG